MAGSSFSALFADPPNDNFYFDEYEYGRYGVDYCNPYTEKCIELSAEIESNSFERALVQDEISWFDSFDLEKNHNDLNFFNKKIKDFYDELKQIESDKKVLENKIVEGESFLGLVINPINWFDKKQRILRTEISCFKRKLKEFNSDLALLKKNIEDGAVSMSEKKILIKKYVCFDKKAASILVSGYNEKILSLEADLRGFKKLKDDLDHKIQPIFKLIRDTDLKKREAENILHQAENIKNKLNAAKNSYERSGIHKECEELFGDGSPNNVIKKNKRIVSQCNRDFKKLETRLVELSNNQIKRNGVSKICIDGNNLCYENGIFIGLPAVVYLAEFLGKNYKVLVVFDSKIRKILNVGDIEIRRQFSPIVEVHIVPTGKFADEVILDISSSEGCYVVSNDRYADYRDKSAVMNNRIIRHSIVDGKIIVQDLGVNLDFK